MPQRVSSNHPRAEVILPVSQLDDRVRWLAARQSGVTATDQRVLAGYGYVGESVYSHWADKFTDPAEVEPPQPLRVLLGTDLEPVIAKHAGKKLGVRMQRSGMIRSVRWAHVIASPDYNCSCGGHVELKTTDRFQLRRHDHEPTPRNADGYVLPPAWYWQGGHQILTSGRDHVHFAALIGRDDLTTWTVTYPELDLERCRLRSDSFWEYVSTKTPPPVDFEMATAQEMAARYPEVKVAMRVIDDQELARFRSLLRARQQFKALAKANKTGLDEVENYLKDAIGAAEEIWAPGQQKPLVRYPVISSRKLDVEALLAAHPEIDAGPFFSTSTYRSFTSVQKLD